MKRILTAIILAGVIASQTSVAMASDYVGMMPQNLIYTSDVSERLLAAATDNTGYGYTPGGVGGGTTGEMGAGGTAGTTGGMGAGGTTGGMGAGGTTGTTGGMGAGGTADTQGRAGDTSGSMGAPGRATTPGTPGGNMGGYTGNTNNYNPNAVGNMNETYQNTNRTGTGYDMILPSSLNNRSQDSNNLFNLNSDTYIVRDGDSLWLVMGQIKAKLDVMIYVDPQNNGAGTQQGSEADKNNLGNLGGTGFGGAGESGTGNTNDNNYYGIPIFK